MHRPEAIEISSFFTVGINYKKTDASIRGKFAISHEQYEQLITTAQDFGIKEFFVLSTCNRTEIYGFSENPGLLSLLLCSQTEGTISDFNRMAYIKAGREAIEHLFNVAAGLDSQILGDYEIVGQIKQAAKFSKERNCLGSYLERITNAVLQASKKIRTNTALSSGTVSVSFAAIQYIREKYGLANDCQSKKILLLGTGKIGSNTCKNLTDYLPKCPVTLVNRTFRKAKALADQFNLGCDTVENLNSCIKDADIILVATNSIEPVIVKKHLSDSKERLVIDLSIPYNVDPAVKDFDWITLVNVDELGKIKDETLSRRMLEVPKVKQIIAEHVAEFIEWHEMRRHVPILKDIKNKLLTIQSDCIFDPAYTDAAGFCNDKIAGDKIQKVINGMAVKMRTQNQPGCHYIEAINDFMSIIP